MKRKTIIGFGIMLVVAAALSIFCELALDHFVDTRIVKKRKNNAIYQLFPDGDPQFIDCSYADGLFVPSSPDPQMIWTLSHDKSMADLMVRFSSPLEEDCEIQVYYDDTGEGFLPEKVMVAVAKAHETEAFVPLERKKYYALRVDINGTVPLSQIDCDTAVIVEKEVPGDFRVNRCLLIFLLITALLSLIFLYHTNDRWRSGVRAYGSFLKSDVVWVLLVSVGLGIYFTLYYHLRDIHNLADASGWAIHPFWPVIAVIFLLLYGSMRVSRKQHLSLGDWLYNYRWPLGLCLLVLCVLLNLNLSSVNAWADYLGTQNKSGVLLGTPRGVRSDEWVKWIGVLKALNYEHYPVFSSLIRATSTENVLIAGQVAWDISALFRPFTWGFLLLNSTSYGRAFYDFGMLIAFFLLSFDFFMLVSGNRKLSFAFACTLLFSPFVQWWTCFSLIISSFALLLAAYKYLTTENIRTKLLCAVCVFVFAGSFALVMYPAWQVPLAYFLLAGLIWIIVKYRNQIKLRPRIDLPIIGSALLFLIACGAVIYLRSAPAIHEMVNTVYPGAVRVNTPQSIDKLFLSYLNIYSPYTSKYIPGPNYSEAADFLTFFPAGILLCAFAMIRNRKWDSFSIIMMALSAFLAVFSFLDVSELLRKITFMSFSMSQRILPWFGFVQVILLFRGVSLMKGSVKWYIAVPVSALFGWFMVRKISASPLIAQRFSMLAGLAALFYIILWTALRAGKSERAMRTFSTVMVFFALFSAGLVHPVQRGMAEIDESAVVKSIRKITQKDSTGKWLVENLFYPYGMVPLLGAAPTINCVNNYPNLEMWYKLDPERDDEFAYNRYVSQIDTTLVSDESTSMSVGKVDDLMDLRLNTADLDEMEVSYILTNRSLDELSSNDVKFNQVDSTNGFIIYHVEYQ